MGMECASAKGESGFSVAIVDANVRIVGVEGAVRCGSGDVVLRDVFLQNDVDRSANVVAGQVSRQDAFIHFDSFNHGGRNVVQIEGRSESGRFDAIDKDPDGAAGHAVEVVLDLR